MSLLRTSGEPKGILIVCPHCRLSSRYDSSYVEDAIKICHDIVCVACGEVFNLIVSIPSQEAEEKQPAPHKCPRCDGRGKVRSTSNSDVVCPLCKGKRKEIDEVPA